MIFCTRNILLKYRFIYQKSRRRHDSSDEDDKEKIDKRTGKMEKEERRKYDRSTSSDRPRSRSRDRKRDSSRERRRYPSPDLKRDGSRERRRRDKSTNRSEFKRGRSADKKDEPVAKKKPDTLTMKTGGAYIPPAKLR